MDLFGDRTTGSADLSSRHDPDTSRLASTGLATVGMARAALGPPRSRVDADDDVIVTSPATRWAVVTGVV